MREGAKERGVVRKRDDGRGEAFLLGVSRPAPLHNKQLAWAKRKDGKILQPSVQLSQLDCHSQSAS